MLGCAWLCLNNSSSHSKADFIVLEKAWKCWLELDLSCLTWLESFGWTWLLIERHLTEKLSQIEKNWQSSNLQISLIYVLDTTWSSLTVLYSALHCLGLLDDRCHLTDFSSSGSSSQPCWIKWLEKLESTWDNFKLCQATSSPSIHFQPKTEFSWWISLLVISGRDSYISHPYIWWLV